jgi:thiamine pyrophosphate-dependent acetolactate synthase large subunit-like protein
MFKRYDALKRCLSVIGDAPCIVSVGLTWHEWDGLRPNDGNFALKTLGSGSSVGLGVALGLPHRKVLILDGDGACLMNVNGLITIGHKQPKNLIHVVWENRMWECSGKVPAQTGQNLDLVTVAKGAGIRNALRVGTVDAFETALKNAFATDGPHFIVAEVAPSDEDSSTAYPRLEEVDNKYRFTRYLEKLEGRKLREDSIDIRLSLH